MEKSFSADINGQPTEFVLQKFSNKWFLLITQYQKICNLFTVQYDTDEELAALIALGPKTIPLTINCQFGSDTDETRSAIQFLVNQTDLNLTRMELIVSLGLKVIDGNQLRKIAPYVNKLLV